MYIPAMSTVLAPVHTHEIFDPCTFAIKVAKVVARIQELRSEIDFNALAGCGNSGLPLLGAVAIQLQMPFFAVRKTMDTSNDSHLANGYIPDGGCRYLIIDDLISSGRTTERIHKHIADTVKTHCPSMTSLVRPAGILLYMSRYFKNSFSVVTQPPVLDPVTGDILRLRKTESVPVFFVDKLIPQAVK